MDDNRKDEVSKLLDFIFKSCCQDADQKLRSTEERLMKFVRYIGWLEGNIIDLFTDEQAEALKERIHLVSYFSDVPDEDEDEKGSFY